MDLINALRAKALTMPVCRQRPPALPARSARPARWPLRRPTRPRPEPIPSARVQELRPPSPAFMSGPFVRRGLPEVARSVAACAYRWITWRCWGEVMTSSPALTMPVTTSTGAGSPSTAWTSATCSAGKGLTRADLVCVALDTLAPKKGAGRFYIMVEGSPGPLRAVLWNRRAKAWACSPDIAARSLYDDRNLDR